MSITNRIRKARARRGLSILMGLALCLAVFLAGVAVLVPQSGDSAISRDLVPAAQEQSPTAAIKARPPRGILLVKEIYCGMGCFSEGEAVEDGAAAGESLTLLTPAIVPQATGPDGPQPADNLEPYFTASYAWSGGQTLQAAIS